MKLVDAVNTLRANERAMQAELLDALQKRLTEIADETTDTNRVDVSVSDHRDCELDDLRGGDN